MIQRFMIVLIAVMVVLWTVGWLLAHLGIILVAGLSFGAWSWWQGRQRA